MKKTSPPAPAAAPGRPRSEQARRAVLDATRDLIHEGGYAAATIEAIAARAGVAKTTIYRWWPNRPTLVVDVVMEVAEKRVPRPVGRDALRALRTEMRGIASVSNTLLGKMLTSLLGEAQHDPAVRAALVDGIFDPRSAASARAVRQARDEGALRKDVHPDLAVDLLVGPLFYRMFVGHRPVTQEFVEQVFHNVLAGLRAPEHARKSTRAKRAPAKPRKKK